MRLILRILLSALAVFIIAELFPGVTVKGYTDALLVALVLGLLFAVLKPILVFFTLPITIVTLGLFLLVINACLILLADRLLSGFDVDGFWWALLFSLVLSFLQSLFYKVLEGPKKID